MRFLPESVNRNEDDQVIRFEPPAKAGGSLVARRNAIHDFLLGARPSSGKAPG